MNARTQLVFRWFVLGMVVVGGVVGCNLGYRAIGGHFPVVYMLLLCGLLGVVWSLLRRWSTHRFEWSTYAKLTAMLIGGCILESLLKDFLETTWWLRGLFWGVLYFACESALSLFHGKVGSYGG